MDHHVPDSSQPYTIHKNVLPPEPHHQEVTALGSCWFPTESQQSQFARQLEGEIIVRKDLKPSFSFPSFSLQVRSIISRIWLRKIDPGCAVYNPVIFPCRRLLNQPNNPSNIRACQDCDGSCQRHNTAEPLPVSSIITFLSKATDIAKDLYCISFHLAHSP